MLCPPDTVTNLMSSNIHCWPECGEIGTFVIVGSLADGMTVSESDRAIW